MAVEFDSIADLVNGVITDYMQDEVEQVQLYVDHPAVRTWMENAQTTSGSAFERNIRLRETPTFKWVGLFELTPNTRVDLMGKIKAVVKHTEEKVHFDEKEEAFTSNDETRIYDHIEEQVNGAVTRVWRGWEEQLVLTPLTSADAANKILGLSGLLPPLAAGSEDSAGSFNGITLRYMNGATTTTIQNIDRSDALNEMARSFVKTRLSADFDESTVRQLRGMRIDCGFKAIPKVKGAAKSMPSLKRFWAMGTDDYAGWLDYVNNSGDGRTPAGDVDSLEDAPLGGLEVMHFPVIDQLDDQPIFMVDQRHIFARILAGRWMSWSKPVNSRDGVDIFTKALRCSGLLVNKHPRHSGGRLHLRIAA